MNKVFNNLTDEDSLLDTNLKTQIYELLADSYIEAVKKRKISSVQRKIISRKILATIQQRKTFNEAAQFLNELQKEYPIFNDALIKFSHLKNISENSKIINKLEQYFIHR